MPTSMGGRPLRFLQGEKPALRSTDFESMVSKPGVHLVRLLVLLVDIRCNKVFRCGAWLLLLS
jgi:hypothetical protein